MRNPLDWYLSVFRRRRRLVLVALLLATILVGSGAAGIEGGLAIAEFDQDTQATAEAEYVEERFLTDDRTLTLVVVRGENTLSKDSLSETLTLQEAIRENETVSPTLADTRPTIGTASVFVESYLRSLGSFGTLDISETQRTFRTFTEAELEAELPEALADDSPLFGPGTTAATLLPTDWNGTASTDARLVLVVHDGDVNETALLEAQRTIETLTTEHVESNETFVFGQALIEQRASDATGATFAVLGPIALVVLVVALLVAYRDPVDVAVTLVGVGVVLVWAAGFVGWAGIELTQLLVAVPWLLLGLAIDYGLHVVMRYREARAAGSVDRVSAMSAGLAGVLLAITATTVTTAAGFLSGAFGPLPAIRDFGVVTAFGILAVLIVFGALVPALKLEVDERLDRSGERRPIGEVPAVQRLLHLGVAGATRAPVAILVVALLVTAGSAYGATQVDTSVDRTDFYPEEPPEWLSVLPIANGGGDVLSEQAQFLDDRFETVGGDDRVDILIRGAVTNESGVRAITVAERDALETAAVKSDGDTAVQTPFNSLDRLAEFNETIAVALDEADQSGDGQPDSDATAAFDAGYAFHAESMEPLVYRDDGGEYRAVRVSVGVESGIEAQAVATEMRAVAEAADEHPGVTATATGGPVVTADRQTALLGTLVQSFAIALIVTVALLVVLFWRRYRSLSLGVATVLPVLAALSWVLGTMYLVGIPYNPETSIITGIAIGLGVDYAIHVSSRFREELDATDDVTALERAVEDTGGALLGSAVTTAGAIGVLLFTFVPSLQRFGLVMVLVVVYAFLAAVFVLPSVLLLQSRTIRDTNQ